MIGLRSISFVILMTILLVSVLWTELPGKIMFMLFAAALAWGGVWEFLSLGHHVGRPSFRRLTAAGGSMAVVIAFMAPNSHMPILAMISLIAAAGWISILFCGNSKAYFERLLNSLAAIVMIILPLLTLVFIYQSGDSGAYLLLYLILVTKAGDTGAYLIGTLSSKILKGNNHKIVPSISPKKSWEGTVGGCLFSIVAAYLLWKYMLVRDETALPLIAGVVLFIGGFAGDLAESVMKRIAGVKDSGKIFPGMGGVLDVVDSLLLNAPIFYFLFFPYF